MSVGFDQALVNRRRHMEPLWVKRAVRLLQTVTA